MPHFRNLEEFLIHGLKYVLRDDQGDADRLRGPSACGVIGQHCCGSSPGLADPVGEVCGLAFQPLHKLAPQAARADKNLYELLTLVDAIRSGRARERKIATKKLRMRLEQHASNSKPQP